MKISACLIVKNEEDCLARCLGSVRELVDEIVVVDTGSEDAGVGIAESFGAKVFHHPWLNNFSLHRNQSLDYAEGDWLLSIDADEVLVYGTGQTAAGVRAGLEAVPENVSALAVVLEDYQQGRLAVKFNSVRLLRRGKVRYKNRVHNQPVFDGPAYPFGLIRIEHYGYDVGPEKMAAKFERTVGLLLDQLEQEPENKDTLFFLCQKYGEAGRYEEAVVWGEKYLAEKDGLGPRFNPTIYWTLSQMYARLGDGDREAGLIKAGLADFPTDPDTAFALSEYGVRTRDAGLIAEGSRRHLQGYREAGLNPARLGTKMHFTIREDIQALQLYRLLLTTLGEGMAAWKALKGKPHLWPKGLERELRRYCRQVGVSLRDLPGDDPGRDSDPPEAASMVPPEAGPLFHPITHGPSPEAD